MRLREDAELLHEAVIGAKIEEAELRRVVPMRVGPRHAENWEVQVHEFVIPRPVAYAWLIDPADERKPRLVVVNGSREIRTAKAAVDVAVAREAAMNAPQ